jgi:mono/diheme cytochrome c family protein
MRRLRHLLTVAVALAVCAAGALPAMRAFWWAREANPIRRGGEVAARAGCFGCHGPQGGNGVPDPAAGEPVPEWTGGVPMMYVDGPDEIREYILDGISKRRAASPAARAARERAAIRMPAYRGALAPGDVDDLVAYVAAVARLAPIDDPAGARGRDLVTTHRCESCHGPAGAGGLRNPGSFKGYVPGWLGPDFGDLVRDDAELRQWILDGGIQRLSGDRLAARFLSRQRVRMPAYKAALSSADADAIGAYIRRLRAHTP